ncbi:GNAT family N-acetyltransferase [Cryptosporangium arvum]|uniref:GNAT family N-acetyltransferase n=1 Tax=Cryptosporangium arvum TaxID=80871 RepID=UPI0004B35C2C|nr:GNAT family N-acetyltransferase [Cryptosporangium arvum]
MRSDAATPTVRILETPEEVEAAFEVFRIALVGLPPLPGRATEISEPGRTFGGYLDGELVGTAASYTTHVVVPGGARLPHAAVTRVGVLPTHTRRGVARALMNAQLSDARQRGVAIATLRAAEGGIYERYGYGVAGRLEVAAVASRRAVLRPGVAGGEVVRLARPADAWTLQREIYERIDPSWTGAISRTGEWWTVRRLRVLDAKQPSMVAVCGPPGAETGYVRYHPAGDEESVVVDDLVTADGTARASLLRYLFSIDLVETVKFDGLALDDPLRVMLVDERPVRSESIEDEIWLRLVDVGAALAARTYRGSGEVVVGVVDEVVAPNAGSYWIGAPGAKPTTAEPQLTVDVAALGAVYLGGTSWRQLAAAGRVTGDLSLVPTADDLFATATAPFCGTFF